MNAQASPAMHSFHWFRCTYQPPQFSRNLQSGARATSEQLGLDYSR